MVVDKDGVGRSKEGSPNCGRRGIKEAVIRRVVFSLNEGGR